jgi:hypothetical protein
VYPKTTPTFFNAVAENHRPNVTPACETVAIMAGLASKPVFHEEENDPRL